MHTHSQIVDDLGGGTKLAEMLRKRVADPPSRESVYKWRRNGIPHRWRPVVAMIALDTGVMLPKGFMVQALPAGHTEGIT